MREIENQRIGEYKMRGVVQDRPLLCEVRPLRKEASLHPHGIDGNAHGSGLASDTCCFYRPYER